jgi:hypothetical protein
MDEPFLTDATPRINPTNESMPIGQVSEELCNSVLSRSMSLATKEHEDMNKVSMIAKRNTKDPIKISFRDVNYKIRV